ncbi:MAG: TetR/AcrR family transcriptional regulator [Emcibacter sp.]|nr:TetR/AcrR family transcriptional regulator [Emcibacter sp.]
MKNIQEKIPKRNRQAKRKMLTRKKLVDAARIVFNAKNIDKTVIVDITEQADVAYGTFYNYFPSIDDVAQAVVEDTLQKHGLRIRKLTSKIDDPALVSATGYRALYKLLHTDPTSSWLSRRPNILAKAMNTIIGPFAISDTLKGVELKVYHLPCSPENWMNFVSWLVIGMLDDTLISDSPEDKEDEYLTIFLRVLGVADSQIESLAAKSKEMTNFLKF